MHGQPRDDYLYASGRRYDLMYPDLPDLPFWLAQARQYGGPILELACGSGRLSIPLAQAGFAVTGVDVSPGMLAEAKGKAAREAIDITWVQGDIRDFDLGRQFALVIFPANALCHLLAMEDFERMAACVLRHLRPGGRFMVSVFVPSFQILQQDPAGRYPFAEYAPPEGGEQVAVWYRNVYRPDTQVNHITLFETAADGTERVVGVLDMRMYFPQELDTLLKYNGLRVERKYGDYAGQPFGPDSPQQIPVCVAGHVPA